jgi:hypothetical protein
MTTKGIKLNHATVMAMRRSKILNGWQWGKSKIFYGNEKFGIDFSGNEPILSWKKLGMGPELLPGWGRGPKTKRLGAGASRPAGRRRATNLAFARTTLEVRVPLKCPPKRKGS